jgi:para-aminobenzoate synthetase/4-amino-4-deoxychorismate lyase
MTRLHPLPAEVYALVDHTPATVLLEGGKQNYSETKEKPWTQLFTAPLRVCAAYSAAEIPALFAEVESAVAAGQCAAGFFSYECGICFEPKAGPCAGGEAQPLARPLAWFGIYDRSYVFDRKTGTFPGGEPPELARFLDGGPLAATDEAGRAPDAKSKISAEFALTEAEYAQRIAAIHEWIRAGDVYQLNFTAPLRIEAPGSAAKLYARLRARQPVDYGAFLHWQPGRRILSFSPELFFRIEHVGATRRIVTRPMKGTARRGRTTREDRAIAEWLRNDPKNRSENLMIVDLVRNDLGRVARTGSVRVENLFAVERYATLWQMTSTIGAELRPEVAFRDIFRALFPCGSVTGAPKVRAMQLIAELEDAPRGVYTGAIGFFSPRQTVFNVAIRTLELDGTHGTMGVGSGIVIDSDPAGEYRECLLKAEFLTRSSTELPERFSLIETMLWDGGYPLGNYPFLGLHLDRLEDSAEYFGFACERAEVKSALEQYARRFPDQAIRKVRLLFDSGGAFEISNEVLPPRAAEKRIGRVRIAAERTDPADPMLYHKTTHRPLYAPEFEQAARDGFDDVLFLNQRGEVTEGAISNVFVEKDGRWFTPPVECGLLPGVYRRHLLETRPEIEERVLFEEDLRTADAIYLANAVRGLRRVEITWREN